MADVPDPGLYSTNRNRLYQSKWWTNITIEPAYALYCLVEVMLRFFYQNLLLQKACRFNLTVEPDLNTTCDDEESGLAFVATAYSWFISPAMFLSVVFTVFAMSWSDRAGNRRRPLLFIPLIGILIECKSALIQSYFWHWPAYATLIPYTITQMVGGRICFTQSAYLYLTDITNEHNRATRYSLLLAIRYFCLPIGSGISGFLLRSIGFFHSFMICYLIAVMALVFSIALVRDISVPPKKKLKFVDMINPKSSIKSLKVILKKRPQNCRSILVMLLVVFSLHSVTFDGEMSILYLYFFRKFHWDEKEYSVYIAFKLFSICAGAVIGSVVFIKWLKLNDGIILIFISGAKIVASICYLLARHKWQIYCVSLMDNYFAVGITVSRSFATKLVGRHEYGYLAAVISLTKVSNPLGQLMYNAVFAVTMSTFVSCFFLVSCILSVLLLILSWMSHYMYKKQNQVIPDHGLIQ